MWNLCEFTFVTIFLAPDKVYLLKPIILEPFLCFCFIYFTIKL